MTQTSINVQTRFQQKCPKRSEDIHLRKTFGYIQRTKFKVGFEVLAKRFNHSSPAVIMRYLGITDKEVNGILMNEI